MSGVLIFVVALGALLLGAFLFLLGVFFYFLYKRLGELAVAVRANTSLLSRIAGEKSLTNLGPALSRLAKHAPEMLAGMRGMTEQIKVWNGLVFNAQTRSTAAVEPEPTAPEREPQSGVFTTSEEDFAEQEEHDRLSKEGINLDNDLGPDGTGAPLAVRIDAE